MRPYEDPSDDSTQSLLHSQRDIPSYGVRASKAHVYFGSVLFLIVGIAPQLMENALFSEVRIYFFKQFNNSFTRLPFTSKTYQNMKSSLLTSFLLLCFPISQASLISLSNNTNDTRNAHFSTSTHFQSDIPFIYSILLGNLAISIFLIYFWNITEQIGNLGQYR